MSGEIGWKDSANKALKGAALESLTSWTIENLPIEPIYPRAAGGASQPFRAAGESWRVHQRIDIPDPKEANAAILSDLEGGANGLDLVFSSSSRAMGYGVDVVDLASLDVLLKNVHLDMVNFHLDGGYETSSYLALFLLLAEKRGVPFSQLKLHSGSDYIGKLASTGRLLTDMSLLTRRIGDLADFTCSKGWTGPILNCDGRRWHDGGGGDAQELAYTMATALRYLRDLERSSLPPEKYPLLLSFTLSADADQFGVIAKARAARRLWASILDTCQMPQTPMQLHMETSWRMMTKRDPYVNILRSCVGAFAAGVGGADSVTVLPFTSALGLPDAFARRVARNTQSILIEESNLHRVTDPGRGSGAIEARTQSLVDEAWRLMQAVEARGGIVEALRSGDIQSALSHTRAKRQEKISTLTQPITGTSAFPNINERQPKVLASEAVDILASVREIELPKPENGNTMSVVYQALKEGVSLPEIISARPKTPPFTVEKIPTSRLSAPFEALFDAARSCSPLPTVFLATLGAPAQHGAKAAWVKNVLASGGVDTVGGASYASSEELVSAFSRSGANCACVCSNDSLDLSLAEKIARALKAAGAEHLLLAQDPEQPEEQLRAAGYKLFLFSGCDVLAQLQKFHELLNVNERAAFQADIEEIKL